MTTPTTLDWQAYLDQLKADQDISDSDKDLLQIFRALFEFDQTVAEAAEDAVNAVAKHFLRTISTEFASLAAREDGGLEFFLHDVLNYVVELAAQVLFPSVEHDKLTDFVCTLHRRGATAFGQDSLNSGFPAFDKALGDVAEDVWRHYEVPLGKDSNHTRERCSGSLSVNLLMVRLFALGVSGSEEADKVISHIEYGALMGSPDDASISTPLSEHGRWCKIEIAAQSTLIAGDALIKTTQEKVDKDMWDSWCRGFGKWADTLPDDAAWNVRADARAAQAKASQLCELLQKD